MCKAIVDIEVTASFGTSFDNGVALAFKSTSPCLDDTAGNITLPANGRPTLLRFTLKTVEVEWTEGSHPGKGKLGFQLKPGADGWESFWIRPKGGNKTQRKHPQFPSCTLEATPPGPPRVIVVEASNSEQGDFPYCLAVGIDMGNGQFLSLRQDPRIRNGGIRLD
ncbi:hypothetical protein [Dokdonella sp.]|uniref:hypothetical protein n=1 Tax=Dokdonella sp. TaxID=2291710 RepID=UPI0031CBCD74|nr:hypothetical protein [Dokdonella sp.]